jgi:hypothetical protein
MGEAEDRILEMLADGTISADEAQELLSVLAADDQDSLGSSEVIESMEVQDAKPHTPPPELSRFRRLWRIPLFVAAGSAVISGAGLILMYQASEQIALLGFMCIWSIFIIALFTAVILLVTLRSTWLYINIEEQDGSGFALGMPMPLGWINWLVKVARPFVPDKQAAYLETAGTFASVMKDDPEAAPIVIDIDDDDGDKVQVFLG